MISCYQTTSTCRDTVPETVTRSLATGLPAPAVTEAVTISLATGLPAPAVTECGSLLHHCFTNSTGCEYQSVLSSGCAFSHTAVFRAQPRHTSRAVFTGPWRTLHVAICAQRTPLRCSSRQLDVQPLGIVRSSWLRRGRGIHCHPPCVVPRH